jgi:hypothetical protein
MRIKGQRGDQEGAVSVLFWELEGLYAHQHSSDGVLEAWCWKGKQDVALMLILGISYREIST